MHKSPPLSRRALHSAWRRPTLPPLIRGSTIGAGGLHCRVREGYGCFPSALATRNLLGVGSSVLGLGPEGTHRSVPNTQYLTPNTHWGTLKTAERLGSVFLLRKRIAVGRRSSPRSIRTGSLHTLPRFHVQPIYQVFFLGPYPAFPVRALILGQASRLDAFSAYPSQT